MTVIRPVLFRWNCYWIDSFCKKQSPVPNFMQIRQFSRWCQVTDRRTDVRPDGSGLLKGVVFNLVETPRSYDTTFRHMSDSSPLGYVAPLICVHWRCDYCCSPQYTHRDVARHVRLPTLLSERLNLGTIVVTLRTNNLRSYNDFWQQIFENCVVARSYVAVYLKLTTWRHYFV